jgi:hypothetical protein
LRIVGRRSSTPSRRSSTASSPRHRVRLPFILKL